MLHFQLGIEPPDLTSQGQMNAVAADGDMDAVRKHFEAALKARTNFL